jgi:O-antigen/teichoic acid export membrane protein
VFFILSAGISLGVADHAELPKVLMVLIVPVAALVAATQTLQNWAAADGRYKQLSYIRVIQAAAIIIFQIALSVISSSPVSLALGYLAGIAVGFSIGIFLCPLSRNDFQSPVSRLIVFWSERRRFPIFSLPADLINTAASQLPVVIIAVRFGAEPAGLVAMAQRMLGAPMSLLAVSILDVFKRHAGQAYLSRGECREEYVDAFRLLVVLAASSAIAILISAEYAFTIVLGDAWIEAGTIAIWLMPRFIIGFVASPLSYMVYIAGKQHLDLMWQLVLLGMTVLTLYIMGASMKASLLSYGVCYGGLYLIYLIMSYRFSLGVKH